MAAVSPAGNPARTTACWLIVVFLAVIATAVISRRDTGIVIPQTWAQSGVGGGRGGDRGIYAFTGQIGSRNYGLFMVDIDTGTLWCYEIERSGLEAPHLRLVAARNWIYDRYLEEFNVASPTPAEVRRMVEQQQAALRGREPRGTPGTGDASIEPPPGFTPREGPESP